MAVLDTFDAYLEYSAIDLHFKKNSNYNYFKYKGKTKKNWDTFMKVNNKRTFTSLASKYKSDYVEFVATAFAQVGGVTWAGDILYEDKYHDAWELHQKYLQSSRIFKDELNGIIQVMDDNDISLNHALINTSKNDIPIIDKLRIQGLVSLETLIILDKVFKYSGQVESKNPRWNRTKKLIDSYTPFLSLNMDKYKTLIKQSDLMNRVVA